MSGEKKVSSIGVDMIVDLACWEIAAAEEEMTRS